MKALELENASKSYKIVKKLQDKEENRLLGFRNVAKFFLGETFSIISTRAVTSITALDSVNFSVEPGQMVYGILGIWLVNKGIAKVRREGLVQVPPA